MSCISAAVGPEHSPLSLPRSGSVLPSILARPGPRERCFLSAPIRTRWQRAGGVSLLHATPEDESSPAPGSEGFTASPFAQAAVQVTVSETLQDTDLELNPENVEKVLDDVRPFLIADGGNVSVAGISNGVVMVEMQGACGSCPASTATLKLGIESALRKAFGGKLAQVVEVKRQEAPVDFASVDAHLDMLRPAITNYGGSCEVLEVKPPICRIKFTGPAPIGQGIKAAIKDKFPAITEVVLEK